MYICVPFLLWEMGQDEEGKTLYTVKEDKAQCKYCNTILKYRSSTTSVLHHLKGQHPTVSVQVESGKESVLAIRGCSDAYRGKNSEAFLYGGKGHDAYKRGGR